MLVSGDLRGVSDAIALLPCVIYDRIRFWAFAYNTALIPVTAGIIYPAFGLRLSPIFAAGAMAVSSLFVVGNALPLQRFKPTRAQSGGVQVTETA